MASIVNMDYLLMNNLNNLLYNLENYLHLYSLYFDLIVIFISSILLSLMLVYYIITNSLFLKL